MRKRFRLNSLRLSRIFAPSLAAVFVLAFNHAFCGVSPGDSFTLTSGPTVTLDDTITETGTQNITFQATSPTSIKLLGTDTFSSNGGTGNITVDASGLLTANAGDVFSASYDFTLALTGTGTVGFTLTGTVTATIPGLGSFPVQVFSKSSDTPLQGPASQEYTGTVSQAVPFGGTNVPWDVQLVATWTNPMEGDTLTVTVPGNSIDLAISPPVAVPEPSTLPLLALGLVAFVGGRRFLPGRRSA